MPQWITRKSAATILKCSRQYVAKLVRLKRLRTHKLYGMSLVSYQDTLKIAAEQQQRAAA